MDRIIDTRIRDHRPSVQVKDATAAALRVGKENPNTVLARVRKDTKNDDGWWHLDDLLRAVVGTDMTSTMAGYYVVPAEVAPNIVAAFDAVSRLGRLEFMATSKDDIA